MTHLNKGNTMTQENIDQSAMEDFVPAKPAGFTGKGDGVQRFYPVPKGGARRARVSLIVDIGTQEREDSYKTADGKLCNFDTPGAIATPQNPAKQVVVFADLVNDTVDYGGDIGKAHYRLLLNGTFNGILKGVVHATSTPPKDAKGNTIKGGVWTMHPNNLLSKLAKATNMDEVIVNGAINRLLNKQFMAQVDVNEKPSGKMDAEGNEIIYKNVNFKGASQVAAVETGEEDENGNMIEAIPEFNQLKVPAMCITFANAKKEHIKYIRPNIIKLIKLAIDYPKSNIRVAIEEFEAERNAAQNDDDGDEAPSEAPKPAAKPKPVKEKAPVVQDAADNNAPF
jgi:hypothetical protein